MQNKIDVLEVGHDVVDHIAIRVLHRGIGEHLLEVVLGQVGIERRPHSVDGGLREDARETVPDRARNVDGLVLELPQRCLPNRPVGVLQHDHRVELSVDAGLHLVGARHDLLRRGQVEVGVLEQARVHQHAQNALAGLAEPGVGVDAVLAGLEIVLPHLVGGQYRQLLVVAAIHVNARLQHGVVPLFDGRLLHAPGHSEDGVRVGVARGDTPVGADDAVVAAVAQAADLDLVVGGADPVAGERLAVAGDRDRVRAHHRGRVLGRHEGLGVFGVVVARVDGVLAGIQVRLTTALTSTVAGPVLDHRVDRVRTPAG